MLCCTLLCCIRKAKAESRRKRGVFCPRCGFDAYEAWLIDRRETIKLYLACVALYVVLIVYVSL